MLTDRQSNELMKASGYLPPARRAAFVKSVENRLRDTPPVAGTALRRAIAFVLANYGISVNVTIKGD
jgi:hypothetical protein